MFNIATDEYNACEDIAAGIYVILESFQERVLCCVLCYNINIIFLVRVAETV